MRKKVIYIGAIVVFLVSVIRIVYVNINADEYRINKETYNKGEHINYNDYDIVVNDITIINSEEMKEIYGYVGNNLDDVQKCYAVVSLDYEYIGEGKAKGLDVANLHLISNTWHNGCEFFATMSINANKYKQEKGKDFCVVFVLSRNMFSEFGWKRIKTRQYQLGFNKYPNLTVINL
ncbi:MAG: hypothetical protein ACI4D4_00275 [Lachnospira sp.]